MSSESDNIDRAVSQAQDPVERFDEARDDLLRSARGVGGDEAYRADRELTMLLAEIRHLAEKKRQEPDGPALTLNGKMFALLERTKNMPHVAKYVPRVRRAVRQMIGMGRFEKRQRKDP